VQLEVTRAGRVTLCGAGQLLAAAPTKLAALARNALCSISDSSLDLSESYQWVDHRSP
jgi:hypothetical protein